MKVLRITFLTALLAFALTCTLSANPITFAQTTQAASGNQFTILNNPAGTVTVAGTGQDWFTYLVPTMAGSAPILSNLLFSATSTQNGDCASLTCTTGGS